MADYKVVWAVDVFDVVSPLAAAREALGLVGADGCRVLTVRDAATGETTDVDLDVIDLDPDASNLDAGDLVTIKVYPEVGPVLRVAATTGELAGDEEAQEAAVKQLTEGNGLKWNMVAWWEVIPVAQDPQFAVKEK